MMQEGTAKMTTVRTPGHRAHLATMSSPGHQAASATSASERPGGESESLEQTINFSLEHSY
jgi:hypothetical protein